MMENLFPTVLMALDVLAGVVCLCHGDIKSCVYWLAAATLTATVTY